MYMCNIKLKNNSKSYKFDLKEMTSYINEEYCNFTIICNSFLNTNILKSSKLNDTFVMNIGINSEVSDIMQLIDTRIAYPSQYPYSLVIDNLHCYFMALRNFKEIKDNYSEMFLLCEDTEEDTSASY